MADFYRLMKTRYADQPFAVEGAKPHGGRWNSNGVSMAYGSDSISLAAFEQLVHLHETAILGRFRLARITIPDDAILTLAPADLPADWYHDPAPSSTAEIGDGWVASGDSLALLVPSAAVPQQHNILINPAHPAFEDALKTVVVENFAFDPRVVKTRVGKT